MIEPNRYRSFDEIREDLEARQRSIMWPDYLAAVGRFYEFLWNGDPNARPVARAGLLLFGLHFLGFGYVGMMACLSGDPEHRLYPGAFISSLFVLFALRVLRNVFLHAPEKQESPEDRGDNDGT